MVEGEVLKIEVIAFGEREWFGRMKDWKFDALFRKNFGDLYLIVEFNL
jgi:hypothetical protein